MSDPAPFLVVRTAEDLAVIEATCRWLSTLNDYSSDCPDAPGVTSTVDGASRVVHVPMVHREGERFAVRFDPMRMRAEAASREALLSLHAQSEGGVCRTCAVADAERWAPVRYPCPTLLVATWPFHDHPDYDPAWDDPVGPAESPAGQSG